MKRRSALWAVAVGGSIAAALDITFAISFAVFHGLPPERLLQSVASGLLGKAAYTGGLPTAAPGLLLHFVMSLLFAAAFVLASKRINVLLRQPVVCGALFGAGVFVFMPLVILPLSAFPHPVSQALDHGAGSVVPRVSVRGSYCIATSFIGGLVQRTLLQVLARSSAGR